MAPRRSWTKANNPYWSTHVETWYRGHLEAEEYCRRRKLSIATFEQWARHLVSPEDLHKRTKHLQKLRRKEQVRQGNKGQPKRRKRPPRYRYSVRTDSGPIALRAFWSNRSRCRRRLLEARRSNAVRCALRCAPLRPPRCSRTMRLRKHRAAAVRCAGPMRPRCR
ncbi:MAG: IS66 family insertion sequence element accessory protein TnpA [Methylocella sp.]